MLNERMLSKAFYSLCLLLVIAKSVCVDDDTNPIIFNVKQASGLSFSGGASEYGGGSTAYSFRSDPCNGAAGTVKTNECITSFAKKIDSIIFNYRYIYGCSGSAQYPTIQLRLVSETNAYTIYQSNPLNGYFYESCADGAPRGSIGCYSPLIENRFSGLDIDVADGTYQFEIIFGNNVQHNVHIDFASLTLEVHWKECDICGLHEKMDQMQTAIDDITYLVNQSNDGIISESQFYVLFSLLVSINVSIILIGLYICYKSQTCFKNINAGYSKVEKIDSKLDE